MTHDEYVERRDEILRDMDDRALGEPYRDIEWVYRKKAQEAIDQLVLDVMGIDSDEVFEGIARDVIRQIVSGE